MDGLEIEFNKLPELIQALHKVGTMKAQETALLIVQYAQSSHPWQNETGQLESTYYVSMQNFSTYGVGFTDGGKSPIDDEIEPPSDDQTAYVSNASSYAPYLEYGTVHIAPLPALGPAAESARSAFESGAGWEEALIQIVGL